MAKADDRNEAQSGQRNDQNSSPSLFRGAGDWRREDQWWRDNFAARPYVSADRGYEYYAPAYRYGYEAVSRYPGRTWDDVESELGRAWGRYPHRGKSTWTEMKDAVRDAWDHVTGDEHGAHWQRDRKEDRATG